MPAANDEASADDRAIEAKRILVVLDSSSRDGQTALRAASLAAKRGLPLEALRVLPRSTGAKTNSERSLARTATRHVLAEIGTPAALAASVRIERGRLLDVLRLIAGEYSLIVISTPTGNRRRKRARSLVHLPCEVLEVSSALQPPTPP